MSKRGRFDFFYFSKFKLKKKIETLCDVDENSKTSDRMYKYLYEFCE